MSFSSRASTTSFALVVSVVVGGTLAACGGSSGKATSGHGGSSFASGSSSSSGAGNASGTGASGPGGSGAGGGINLATSTGSATGGGTQGFDVVPSAQQTLAVVVGQTPPTVTFQATLNGMAAPATAWGVDQGDIGTVPAGPSSSAIFTPSGTAGGFVTVTAALNKQSVQRQVLVKLSATQNGANASSAAEQPQIPSGVGALTQGGGVGGVGGTGLGGGVTDAPTLAALNAPASNGAAQGLGFLYPYDKTVWPRGLPAPLLQWTWSTGDADAIKISLSTANGSYSYAGTFARPAILAQTGGNFINHPIPQDVWDMATNSAGGSTNPLTVSLVVAKGGVAYGPITETWTIAPARLSGTIYYNSYGTQLVQNSAGAIGGNGEFGAAVLRIRVGDTAPTVIAGSNSECRTCHSVAAFGSRLEAQPYGNYSDFDLSPTGSVETVLPNSGGWFPAVYPDGSKMLTSDGQLLPLPLGGASLALSGLPNDPETPAFSPDGTLLAFNVGAGSVLSVMDFDNPTGAFTNQVTVVDDSGSSLIPAWPGFFPDSKSIVFHHQSDPGIDPGGNPDPCTRGGALAQVHWANLSGPSSVTSLDQLNGKGYLPKLPTPANLACDADGNAVGGIDADHSDDVDHNYEPTVNPIASGGYAWVVFTSRRMYGNVAAIPPFCSDPRGVDLVSNITPKKLWVAAIDLTQAPGTDSSHPAFYLPAQELLAGNSRGFWVLDPCQADGTSCTTGDQCCNGFCEPAGDGGALICASAPPMGSCSGLADKCTTAANCCDPTNVCVNGFCTQSTPTRK
jgi:hypothetical protein